jgi:hypothetical protein
VRRASLAWIAALPIVGVVELGAQLFFERRAPDAIDYEALRGPFAALHQPGDLVVVEPRWAEPHARRVLGDVAFPLEVVARPDDERFARAVVIALPGASGELDGFRERSAQGVGPFTLHLLERTDPRPVLFDFVGALGPARATVDDGDPCRFSDRAPVVTGGLFGSPTRPRARFLCGRGELDVGVTVLADERYLPRRCIAAAPLPEAGEPRRIRFAGVTLGGRIVGHTGVHVMTDRERRGPGVTLEVSVDDEVLGAVEHAPGDGWRRFELSTGRHAGRADARVVFTIVADAAYEGALPFCFEAVTQ